MKLLIIAILSEYNQDFLRHLMYMPMAPATKRKPTTIFRDFFQPMPGSQVPSTGRREARAKNINKPMAKANSHFIRSISVKYSMGYAVNLP